jgi:CRISPR-associated endonuclease Csn1
MKTLGIDLGTNSLGWAILDSEKPPHSAITDSGVVIFEEGIKRDKGNDSLETPAAERRRHRMARRLKFRRRMRKIKILGILIEHGMCPLKPEELARWKNQDEYPLGNREFLAWLKSTRTDNPYGDRAAAATEKVPPEVLGRAIYHLAQRRGFKSSRKDAPAEDAERPKKKTDERSLVKNSIAELTAILDEKQITLGQHFYDLYQNGKKVRGCYTGRKEHYEKEFDAIARVQEMDDTLAAQIRNILFFQRPLRSQSHLIGKCPLEKKHNRCLVAHPVFEAYRMWSFINTIRVIGEDGERIPLADEDRKKAAKAFFKSARYISFADIAKTLKKPKGTRYNYPPKKTIATCSVTHQLNKVLGGDCFQWFRTVHKPNGGKTTYTYQTAFDALMFFEDPDRLQAFAREKLGLEETEAAAFAKIVCREGYAQYSLCALQKITPFLKKGIELSQAIFLANLPDVLGPGVFQTHENEIIADVAERNADYRENLRVRGQDPKIGVVALQQRLKDYAKSRWQLSDADFDRLYFRDPNTDDSYASVQPQDGMLPPVNLGMMRNPLVQRTLTILRRHVNFLRRTGRIDANTRIHVELARSVNDRNTRMAFAVWQKTREDARENARQRLIEDIKCPNPSDTDILRYILWQEQGTKCLYSGNTIAPHELLTDAYDIEHTIPRCRSGNNSQANLTLCEHAFNCQRKKGRIPSECDNYEEILARLKPWQDKLSALEETYLKQMKTAKNTPADNPEAKAKNRQKALATKMELNYWRDKVYAFTVQADRLNQGFMNRQLVDTGIITKHAVALLRSVYPRTYPVNGTAVAWARQGWGIQSIREKKERTTHLHHAIDAMVVAGLSRDRFNQICAFCKDDGEKDYDITFPDELHPFRGFSQAVFDSTESILVKHVPRHVEMKQTRRTAVRLARPIWTKDGKIHRTVPARGDTVRGQLHKESFYGCIQSPESGGKLFVIRKFLNSENFGSEADIAKIVDPAVRNIVLEQIRSQMDEGTAFKKIMDGTEFRMPSGVPIRKVRITAKVSEPQEIRRQVFTSKHDYKIPYYVESGTGSNFRLALFMQEAKGKIKWHAEPDNLLDWAKRGSDSEQLHLRTDLGHFKGYILPGAMALVYDQNPDELRALRPVDMKRRLYQVIKFNTKDRRITFCLHSEARASTDLSKYLKSIDKHAAGESSIDFIQAHELLLLSPGTYLSHVLFEGIHFDMDWTGKITFRDNAC